MRHAQEPVVFLLHVAHPRIPFTDRGKSTVTIADMDGDIIVKAVEGVTAEWKRQRDREKRDARSAISRREAFVKATKVSVKDAAWHVMEAAYLQASGTLSAATARQIYYQARGPIQEITGKTGLNSQYFSQTLVPEYERQNPETASSWDVLYDARGDFHEPHTGRSVPLGTLEVRGYLHGADRPDELFGALLYIEKQGFDELFRKVQLAERFDIGILSAKGQSVTACRHLADELCGTYGMPLLVLHDFDLAGLNILHTLRNDTRRYTFKNEINVVDFGLRLEDAKEWGLESERVCYGRTKAGKARDPLDWRSSGRQRKRRTSFAAKRPAPAGSGSGWN